MYKSIKSFDGTRIYYCLSRAGSKFVVFLHGWAQNHTVWHKEINFFNRKGYSTIALDLRGHGKSGKPKRLKDYSFENFAKDLHLILAKEKVADFILAGHSFGGMIALAYYSMFPEGVARIVLVDTTYKDPLKERPIARQFYQMPLTKRLLEFILRNNDIKKKHFRFVDFSKFKKHSDFFYWIKGAREIPMKSLYASFKIMIKFDEKKVLKKINVPVLIIQGEKDARIPVWIAKSMQEQIKDSRLKIMKGSHDLNLREPAKVAEAIYEFIMEKEIFK